MDTTCSYGARFSHIPTHLQLEILGYLDPRDLVTLINVSKDLVPLATQDQVWRPHTERLFINKPSRINISIHETWFFVYKRRTLKNRKLEDRAERTVEFWNKQFLTDDETVKEWFIDAQLTTQLVIPHLKPTSKVLIIGCGLSNLGPCLYDAGYRFITSTDISDVAIDAMRTEHQIKRPEMVWAMGDATRMQDTMLDASFDVILDKGVSDTILFRHNQKEGKFFIQELYNEVYRVLKPDGKYLVFSPRRKVPWAKTPDRIETGRARPDRFVPNQHAVWSDISTVRVAEQSSKTEKTKTKDIYFHVCSKEPPTADDGSATPV